MTEERADPAIRTTYQGRVIAFCCDKCLAKFRADPERYAARLALRPNVAEPGAATGGDITATGRADTLQAMDHEHERADEGTAVRPPLLGRIHPLLVHFPIAGLWLALLGFGLHRATGRAAFAAADVVPLGLAAIVAVAAVITGNLAEEAARFGPGMHEFVERHELAGTTVMVLSLGLAALRLWRWNRLDGPWRWVYALGLLAAAGLVAVTGYLGGVLVFGPQHLSW